MIPRVLQTEPTDQGDQTLVPGVRPVTTGDRLQLLLDAPLAPRRPQKPCDVGLFDECARRQLDLFNPTKTKKGKNHDY